MAFTKINAAGIGTTETVTVDGLTVINDGSFGGNLTVSGVLTYEDVTNVDSVGLITARNGIVVGSGITLSKDGDGFFTGVTTATTFVGALTGDVTGTASQVTIANGADNRILTAASANTINGESNLTFNGTDLSVTGTANVAGTLILQPGGTAWSTTNTRPQLGRQADGELRLGAGSDSSSIVTFYSSPSAGGTLVERLRITSAGLVGIGTVSPAHALDIQGSSASFTKIALSNQTMNTSKYEIIFGDQGQVNHVVAANREITFATNNTERLRIDSSGNVNIGSNISANPFTYLRFGASQYGAADIRPTNESSHKVGLAFYVDGTEDTTINPVEKMRITNDGRILIGATSSTSPAKLAVNGGISNSEAFFELNRTDDPASGQNIGIIEFCQGNSASRLAARLITRRDGGVWGASSLPTRFEIHTCSNGSNTAAERFRIDSAGNIFLDATFNTTADNARKSYFTNTGQQFHARNAHEAYIIFQDVSNNQIGSIVRGAGASIAFNTTSDYRLKENVVTLSDAITRLKTLSPKRFNFKSAPSITLDGFLAHEVTAVPEAVEGEKDGVITQAMLDAGTLEGTVGDPIYQGIDQSKLVPLLTAALQEAVAKIETLETKVAALEG